MALEVVSGRAPGYKIIRSTSRKHYCVCTDAEWEEFMESIREGQRQAYEEEHE